MTRISFLIVIFFISQLEMAGQVSPFKIENNKVSNNKKPIKRENSIFFEDEKYVVTNHCGGEFGGTIIFKEKLSGLEYGCEAHCAVIINKINGKYYVSNAYNDGDAISEILEIDNPKKMELISEKPIAEFKKVGAKVISEIKGFVILISFPFENKLYHIITDERQIYLVEIFSNQHKVVNVLSEEKLYISEPEIIKLANNHFFLFDAGNENFGYIEINKNVITLNKYE